MRVERLPNGSLKAVSTNRLVCLLRHWTWADEAKARFERELAGGWEYETDPPADHLLGTYCHWCALLCAFSEAFLEHEVLPTLQLDMLGSDVEACLPLPRRCPQVLVAIPPSREDHPRIVDLLRDDETLRRLRRIHGAMGEAIRDELMSRAIEFLDGHER